MRLWIRRMWRENKSLVVFITLMMVFRSAVADWSDVPTGSMKPTILEGDRIFVNKMAYDLRVPFTHISLINIADPQPNDIIIFDSVVSDKRLVKRVIGVPGDTVAMDSNRLIINGQALNYALHRKVSGGRHEVESFQDQSRVLTITQKGTPIDSFASVKVPDDHYLVLGDNRDLSADSRVIGFVPRNEIVGKSTKVAFSLDYENYFLPRVDRFFHQL